MYDPIEKRFRAEALRRMLGKSPGLADVPFVLHLRARHGEMTRVLLEAAEKASLHQTIHAWEESRDGIEMLKKLSSPFATLVRFWGDGLAASVSTSALPEDSGVVADVDCTLLRAQRELQRCLSAIFKARPSWVILSDTAREMLYLNWQSYGLGSDCEEDYLSAMGGFIRNRYGYQLQRTEMASRRSNLLLFTR